MPFYLRKSVNFGLLMLLLFLWAVNAQAQVCRIVKDEGTKQTKAFVARPGKASELTALLDAKEATEAFACCVACTPDVGSNIVVTKRGAIEISIRVLDGPDAGCSGDVYQKQIGQCEQASEATTERHTGEEKEDRWIDATGVILMQQTRVIMSGAKTPQAGCQYLATVCDRNKNADAEFARWKTAFDACVASRKCSLTELEHNVRSGQEGLERRLRPLATVKALRERFPSQAQACLEQVIAAECREWIDPSILTEPPGSHK